MSIRNKLILTVCFATIVPFSCLFWGAQQGAKESLIVATGTKFEELANYTINALDQLLYVRRLDLENLRKNPLLQDAKSPESLLKISEALKTWKRDYGVYSALYLINNDGKIVASSENTTIGKNVENEIWYQNSLQLLNYSPPMVEKDNSNKVQAVIGDLEYDSLSGSYGINFAIPILSSNPNNIEQLGILVSRLNWSEIYNITNSIRVANGTQNEKSYAITINKNGQIVTGPGFLLPGETETDKNKNPEVLFSQNLKDRNWLAVTKALSGEKGYSSEKYLGDTFVVGYSDSSGYLDFKGLGWSVLVIQNTSETFAVLNEKTRLVIIISVLIILLAIALSFYYGTSIRSRLKELSDYTATLRKGYTKERIPADGSDEVGQLRSDLNSMAESIDQQLEDQRALRAKAEAANRQKGHFLADLAEELRSPLSNMLEMNEALLTTQLSADQRSVLNSIRKTATSVIACANEMRDIAKIETGQLGIENKPFNLKHLVEEVVEVLSISARNMGVSIEMQYDASLPSICLSDTVRLHQLFTNILAHALKYCRQNKMYIMLSSDGLCENVASLRVVIADSTIALNKDRLKHLVTESISSAETPTADAFSPDIATSRRLAELLGGSLGVVLAQDDGMVIWMSLPMPVEN